MQSALRILHLEDKSLDSELAANLLRKEGVPAQVDRVVTLRDFSDALERGGYGLILGDYSLPGVDPLEALRLARQRSPEVPFIFLSGTMGEETAIETLKLGATDYVLKQRMERLVPAVRRALQEVDEQARRKEAEAALRESEQRYRTLFDSIDEGYCIIEMRIEPDEPLDYRFIEVNQAFEKQSTLVNAKGKWMRELRPEHEESWFEIYRDVALTGKPVRFEHGGRALQDRWFTLYAFRIGAPEQRRVAVLFNDITERKRAEEALRQARDEAQRRAREAEAREQVFTTMMEHIPIGITIADAPDVSIRAVSRYGRELTGKPRQQIEGISVDLHAERWQIYRSDGVTPATNEELPLTRATQKGEVVREEVFVIGRPDGSKVPILCTAAPIRDAQGNITGGVIGWQDITEGKRAEEELRAAKLSAEQAKVAAEQANAAKDHFLAALSHELRTPLTPVLTTASLLEADDRLPERYREDLAIIRRNVELEARLIDDLLDVTRIVRGKVELHKRPVRLCEVIRRAVEVCRADIEARRLEFGVEIGPDAPYVIEADVVRLQQVFWNLLKNAIKFTPHGGCVGIRCRRVDAHVVAEVIDSGAGIEPDMLPKLFSPFEQGRLGMTRQFGGLGLGLVIAKGLVEMHDGTTSARSEGIDKGASFQITLPLAGPESAAGAGSAPATPEAAAPCRALTILLVEDHGDTAKIMKRLLTARGYQVQTAGDVGTALEVASERHFDLLISDLGLPDGSGIDLMRQLRARGHPIPSIALSGYGQEEDLRRSKAAGFAAHLTKPTSPDRLFEAIVAVAGQSCGNPMDVGDNK